MPVRVALDAIKIVSSERIGTSDKVTVVSAEGDGTRSKGQRRSSVAYTHCAARARSSAATVAGLTVNDECIRVHPDVYVQLSPNGALRDITLRWRQVP